MSKKVKSQQNNFSKMYFTLSKIDTLFALEASTLIKKKISGMSKSSRMRMPEGQPTLKLYAPRDLGLTALIKKGES